LAILLRKRPQAVQCRNMRIRISIFGAVDRIRNEISFTTTRHWACVVQQH
jgi:hypothetical protein